MESAKLNIHHYTMASEATTGVAIQLCDMLLNQTKPALLLLSGGSALDIVDMVDSELMSRENITIYPLDERFSNDPTANNSLLLRERGAPTYALVPDTGETVEHMGERFDKTLKDWRQKHPQGVIICTFGVGPDGHTSGISPMDDSERFAQLFSKSNAHAVGYRGSLTPPERVTTTATFLQTQVDVAIGLVCGKAKQVVWNAFVSKNTPIHTHPMQLWHSSRADISVHTDLCSSSLL